LEEQRVAFAGNRRRLKGQHRPHGEFAGAEVALSHAHEPVGREKFVAAARARLLLVEHEHIRVKHQRPRAFDFHQHGSRGGIGFRARARGIVRENFLHEGLRGHVHLVVRAHLHALHLAHVHSLHARHWAGAVRLLSRRERR
jgi:hypothetical protein